MIILLDENVPLRFFLSKKWNGNFFELYDDGILRPVKVIKR
jgi:hypothetical protein